MDKKFKISTFSNKFAKVPVEAEIDLRKLAKALMLPAVPYPVREKGSLPLWSPTSFAGNRSGAHAIEISCLVFDLDDGTDYAFHTAFSQYHYIAHTSFSHTEEINKWRIVLPLEIPIPAADWKRAAKAGKELWDNLAGQGEPDSSALNDCARMYYRYAIPDRSDADLQGTKAHKGEGLLRLEYSHIPKEEPKKRYKRWESKRAGSKSGMEALFHNPEYRRALAQQIGASIEGNVARNITCPACNKREVYYSIDPDLMHAVRYPHCNRANKCGWWGFLEALI
tara:strand:+ start:4395 stop:5237 length:843 start_codon:yes stop_codon:yes gene_type:complete